MNTKLVREKGKATLYISGNIDVIGSESLKYTFSEIVENDSIKDVSLDFKSRG